MSLVRAARENPSLMGVLGRCVVWSIHKPVLGPRPAILRVASELDGIRRISALHHHSFKEIAAQTAVDRFQASVEIWHGIPIVPDRGRQEQGVLGERLPLARGQARDSEADPLGRVGRTQPVTPCGCG